MLFLKGRPEIGGSSFDGHTWRMDNHIVSLFCRNKNYPPLVKGSNGTCIIFIHLSIDVFSHLESAASKGDVELSRLIRGWSWSCCFWVSKINHDRYVADNLDVC